MDSSLFSLDRHEALSQLAWNEVQAREAIRDIVRDTEANFDEAKFWPAHAEDDWSGGQQMLSLFWGASSTVWGLLKLRDLQAVTLDRSYGDFSTNIFATYLRIPDTGENGQVAPGLLFGKLGFQLLEYRFGLNKPSKEELVASIVETIRQPELEMMWGAPGAILACNWLYEWTADREWMELKSQASEFLYNNMVLNTTCDVHVWTQHLYGQVRQYLGAVHGAAGNYQALLMCRDVMPTGVGEEVSRRALKFLRQTSKQEGDYVNWPNSIDSDVRRFFVQWCHGSVGVLTSLIDPLFAEAPELFIRAGNLIWKAGPLNKRFGLCHGTAGNGYAFLKLYKHTKDALWLERARSFAMHALSQSNAEFQKHSRRRFALLTGDIGLAIYLQACIDKDSRWPLVDWF